MPVTIFTLILEAIRTFFYMLIDSLQYLTTAFVVVLLFCILEIVLENIGKATKKRLNKRFQKRTGRHGGQSIAYRLFVIHVIC